FKAPPTTEIYTLSLHDALPIYEVAVADGNGGDEHAHERRAALAPPGGVLRSRRSEQQPDCGERERDAREFIGREGLAVEKHRERSEEHTSELQSLAYLVCRLLL